MDQPTGPAPAGKPNRANTGLLLLVLLLLMSNAAMLYLYLQSKDHGQVAEAKLDQVSSEKDNVTHLLEEMLVSYDTLKTDHERTMAEMGAQKEEIERLLDKVKRGGYDLAKAKKEAETLRTIMKGYVVTIDSLNQANQLLAAEVATTRQELGEVTGRMGALQSRTEVLEGQVAKGSVLHTTSISAGALFVRSNGKQVDTDRASKAEMVKCCFVLGENRVAKAGDKTIYMRVITPDGKVLPSNEPNNRFRFGGVEGEFSARREVNYQNQPLDVCIFWSGTDKLATGQYRVEVYENGELVSAQAVFNLK